MDTPAQPIAAGRVAARRVRAWLAWSARANVLLAVAVAASTWMVQALCGLRPDPVGPLVMGLVYYSIYTLDRAADHAADARTHPERAAFARRNARAMLATAIVAYAAAVALALPYGTRAVAATLIPLFALVAYSFPIVPAPLARRVGFSRVKEVLVLKNVWVAATEGTSVPLIAAAVDGGAVETAPLLAAAGFVFGRWWINSIAFDVRDEAGDRANGLRTVPVVLGPARTFRILHAANVLLAVVYVVLPLAGVVSGRFALLAFSSLYAAWYLWRMQRGGDPHFLCDVVADAELGVQAAIVALALP